MPRQPRLISAIAVAALALLSLPWTAARAVDWYLVEMIVFEELSDTGLLEEKWSGDPGTPSLEGAIELTVALDGVDPGALHAFKIVDDDTRQLRDTWAALRRSAGYRPLLHLAWQQPGLPEREALATHVSTRLAGDGDASGAFALPKVEGTVRVYRTRYLHVELDLAYRRWPETAAAVAPVEGSATLASATSARALSGDPLRPARFRMTDRRRMRSRELHYVDHPLFGVLLLATPIQAEEPATVAPASPATGTETAAPAAASAPTTTQ